MRPARLTLLALTTALSLSPVLAAADAAAMTPAEARHLISRTGFGASPAEIAAFTGLSYAEAVDRLLAGVDGVPPQPLPGWTTGWTPPGEHIWALNQTAGELYFTLRWVEMEDLRMWWIAQMIATDSPLEERLTLIWTDHFPTSFESHESSRWSAAQNATFRKFAAGNFADLAAAVLEDPGMRVYLTNTDNVAEAPNENLAREFFELFMLGEGRGYTEADVTEAARALTGHTVAEMTEPVAVFAEESHDGGRKTILGQTGRWTGADLPRIAMDSPEFGPMVVEMLWREFISDTPDPAEVTRLVEVWRAAEWELKPLLREMFLSEAFWAEENRGRLIKSPVEMYVGTVRSLGLAVPDLRDAGWRMGELGQPLFMPRNVGGFPHGTEWLNDATASGRAAWMTELVTWDRDAEPAPRMLDMMSMMAPEPFEPVALSADDLRVGQVFVPWTERRDGEGVGAVVVLFDVGFGGEDWRSVPLWIEWSPGEGDEPFVGILTADCAPGCFASWPYPPDEEGWIGFGVSPDDAGELVDMEDMDRALLASIAGHLPALVGSTEGHRSWNPDWAEDDFEEHAASLPDVRALAERIASDMGGHVGAPPGDLVLAVSRPGVLGLGGAGPALAGGARMQTDAMIEEIEETAYRAAYPPVVYESAAHWLAALPDPGGVDSRRAEAALLAVPLPDTGRRDEMRASDPEALLRTLTLSPFFQVN